MSGQVIKDSLCYLEQPHSFTCNLLTTELDVYWGLCSTFHHCFNVELNTLNLQQFFFYFNFNVIFRSLRKNKIYFFFYCPGR